WQVLCDLATRLGYPMRYQSPEEIFAEFAALTTSYQGLTYERLGRTGKLWPCPDPEPSDGRAVLFDDGFPTPSRRGRFLPFAPRRRGRSGPGPPAPARELPDAEYPWVLNPGRLLEHWHTGTMTRRAAALNGLQPGPFVEIPPEDMARLDITDGSLVTVRSRRG